MKKYRYITSGTVEFDKPVSTYRLAAGNSIGNDLILLRVTIPDDMANEFETVGDAVKYLAQALN